MKKILYRVVNIVLAVVDVGGVIWVILLLSGFETEVRAMVHGVEFQSLEYRGTKLYWEIGNPMPKERVEIFYTVVDSLADDVTKEYSLSENPVEIFYLTTERFFYKEGSIRKVEPWAIAYAGRGEIILGPGTVDVDDGYFAMALVHEYVHVVQFNNPGYLNNYSSDVGWQGDAKPEEDENFYRVLSPYSLEAPYEDMSETYMYSYLCGNNLEGLSEVRLQYIEDFWKVPREQYCRNFH